MERPRRGGASGVIVVVGTLTSGRYLASIDEWSSAPPEAEDLGLNPTKTG